MKKTCFNEIQQFTFLENVYFSVSALTNFSSKSVASHCVVYFVFTVVLCSRVNLLTSQHQREVYDIVHLKTTAATLLKQIAIEQDS